MSLRNDWTFTFSAERVAAAAQFQAGYHDGRVQYWEDERRDVLKDLKSAGLEVTEYEVTGGARHDVQFDPKLTKRLSEAASKIQTHQREAERFHMFADVLADQGNKPLELHPDDVHYFGLAQSAF